MAKKTTRKKTVKKKAVTTLTHDEAKRPNIPTAEFQSVVAKDVQKPIRVAYERGAGGLEEEKAGRNRDLDPQLVWRGKDEKDWSDLVLQAPPLSIQEKIHPKVIIEDFILRNSIVPDGWEDEMSEEMKIEHLKEIKFKKLEPDAALRLRALLPPEDEG